jgi:rhamnosyltransferase
MSQPSVSVVIPVKNGRPTLAGCLDGVLAQEYDGAVDVLAIDSGSTDGSLEDIAARPSVGLHRIHPRAFDHGDTRNLGAGLTRGELIVLLVQDAEPVGTEWLSTLIRNFEDEQVAGVFSRILPRPDAGPLVMRGCEGDLCFASERVEVRMDSPDLWAALDPHSLRVRCNYNDVASCMRRSVWEQLPLVRGMMGEDIKFAKAALEAGWTIVFDPESQVLHSHEYEAATVYARTFIDADLNQRLLARPCIGSLRDALIMTGRSWKADREYLAARPELTQRLKWTLLSPVYHFAEFYGFWKGGKAALADQPQPTPPQRAVPPGPLKVLMVVHGFPPDSWAGVEVLSLTLARALRERGHEVVLFVRSPGTQDEPDRSLSESGFDGFRVHRFVNQLAFSGVDETYRFAPAEQAFDRVLAAEQPDVVHLQHMIHLSTGLIDRCRAVDVPCVATVSDFWPRCPKVQLIRDDRTNCTLPPPGLGCAPCVKGKPALVPAMARFDRWLGPLPRIWAQRVGQSVPPLPPGRQKSKEDMAALVRREVWMAEVLQRLDALVVPSATLKRALEGLGIPPAQVRLSAYGLDTRWLADGPPERRPREPGQPLRVGFIGSIVWYKGLEVAARAVAALGDKETGAAVLHVHGDHEGGNDPTVAALIRSVTDSARAIAGDRIEFHGRFDHDQLAANHAGLDVLVVPSLWQEAYGLTVREAHLAHTPVVGSDIAGIAEGIEHDVNGLLFPPGDAAALGRALRRFLDEPGLGERLTSAAPPIKTDAQEAEEWEWRYRQVISCSPRARSNSDGALVR